MKHVTRGTPQGSILGLTLYTLFVNEMSEAVNDPERCKDDLHKSSIILFSTNCKQCGMLYGYTDDSMYVITGKDRSKIQE